MLSAEIAYRWLIANGWERFSPMANVWCHHTLSRDRACSTERAIEMTMRADVERATIPEAR